MSGDGGSDDDPDAPLDESLLPLPALFARGFAAHLTSDAGSADAGAVAGGVRALRLAAAAARRLALFSPNECLDDVSTPQLKYLLTPYLLAEARRGCLRRPSRAP